MTLSHEYCSALLSLVEAKEKTRRDFGAVRCGAVRWNSRICTMVGGYHLNAREATISTTGSMSLSPPPKTDVVSRNRVYLVRINIDNFLAI